MKNFRLTIVFDNTTLEQSCTPEWGFACLLEFPDENILFDTGNDGDILAHNLKTLGFAETQLAKIIVSHAHWDHTGGLAAMLGVQPNTILYLPASAAKEEISKIQSKKIEFVKEPRQIAPSLFSLGEKPGMAFEQSIAIKTTEGLVIFTGCAHPGIVNIVADAHKQFPNEAIRLVLGGFHLGRHSEQQVLDIIGELKKLGVTQVAPTHCTGEAAIALFRQNFGENFLQVGVGFKLEFLAVED